MRVPTTFTIATLASVLAGGVAFVAPSTAIADESYDVDALRVVAEQYLQSYADQVVTPATPRATSPLVALAALPTTNALANEIALESDILSARRAELHDLGVVYTGADISTSVLAVTEGAGNVVLTVRELATLPYPSGTGPEALEYVSQHDFTFVSQDGEWLLADERPSGSSAVGLPQDTQVVAADEVDYTAPAAVVADPDGDPLNPSNSAAMCGTYNGCLLDDNVPAAAKFPTSLASDTDVPLPGTQEVSDLRVNPALSLGAMDASPAAANIPAGLDYGKMRDYALRHALSYNTNYRSWSQDCTNFISQIMRTGGWKHDTGWYRSDGNWWYNSFNQTYTWAGAENWSRFAPKRTEHLSRVYDMWLVDVLQIDFNRDNTMDHSMIVTSRSSSELYLSYHSNDTKNRAFRSIYSGARSAWYYAYRT